MYIRNRHVCTIGAGVIWPWRCNRTPPTNAGTQTFVNKTPKQTHVHVLSNTTVDSAIVGGKQKSFRRGLEDIPREWLFPEIAVVTREYRVRTCGLRGGPYTRFISPHGRLMQCQYWEISLRFAFGFVRLAQLSGASRTNFLISSSK